MTISSTTRITAPFIGTGVSVPTFPFAFKVFVASDLLVALTSQSAPLTLTSDYSVALNADQDGSPGGSITLNPASTNVNIAGGILPILTNMVISSQVPQLQSTTLTNFGGFFPTVINAALDRLTILVQQVQQLLGRGITAPITDTPGLNYQVPSVALRANMSLGFDSVGNVIVGAVSSTIISAAMIPVVQAASLAAGRTAFGAAASGANADITSLQAGATIPTPAFGDSTTKIANMAALAAVAAGVALAPIGVPFAMWDHLTGITVPSNAGTQKYIRLTAGQSGVGGFNNGLLTGESVSGSAPLVVATANIATGPLNGQTIHLLNSENAFVRGDVTSGTQQQDQAQQITGQITAVIVGTPTASIGALAVTAATTGAAYTGSASTTRNLTFDNSTSTSPATARVGTETRAKNVSATYYMRIV